jgi:hypothetical protein
MERQYFSYTQVTYQEKENKSEKILNVSHRRTGK